MRISTPLSITASCSLGERSQASLYYLLNTSNTLITGTNRWNNSRSWFPWRHVWRFAKEHSRSCLPHENMIINSSTIYFAWSRTFWSIRLSVNTLLIDSSNWSTKGLFGRVQVWLISKFILIQMSLILRWRADPHFVQTMSVNINNGCSEVKHSCLPSIVII